MDDDLHFLDETVNNFVIVFQLHLILRIDLEDNQFLNSFPKLLYLRESMVLFEDLLLVVLVFDGIALAESLDLLCSRVLCVEQLELVDQLGLEGLQFSESRRFRDEESEVVLDVGDHYLDLRFDGEGKLVLVLAGEVEVGF
jgi:hypothetical protein